MSRPKRCRNVATVPGNTCFMPQGKNDGPLEEVFLTLDEFEAIRLADLEGLYQGQAASKMSVSRQTFGRIIESAHRKVANVLINGKILRIEGGDVMIEDTAFFRCHRCRQTFRLCCNTGETVTCPHCKMQILNFINP